MYQVIGLLEFCETIKNEKSRIKIGDKKRIIVGVPKALSGEFEFGDLNCLVEYDNENNVTKEIIYKSTKSKIIRFSDELKDTFKLEDIPDCTFKESYLGIVSLASMVYKNTEDKGNLLSITNIIYIITTDESGEKRRQNNFSFELETIL